MIKREDFIFTIGYSGSSAIVDSSLKKKFGSLDSEELAKKGLFKAALCSVIFANRESELDKVLAIYNSKTKEEAISSPEELKRKFGVFEVPAEITRVIRI